MLSNWWFIRKYIKWRLYRLSTGSGIPYEHFCELERLGYDEVKRIVAEHDARTKPTNAA